MMTRQLPSLTRKSMARGHLGEATLLAAALLASACDGTLNQDRKDQTESVEQAVTAADKFVAVFGNEELFPLLKMAGDSSGVTGYAAALEKRTNAVVAAVNGGGYEVAFNDATTHTLWRWSSASGYKATYCSIDPASSPSITGLATGGYQIAFQNAAHQLCVYGTAGFQCTGYGVNPGTSPAISALPGAGYLVAFHAYQESGKPTGYLWVYDGTTNMGYSTGQFMEPGTSPSIATRSDGWQIAYQGYNYYGIYNHLMTFDNSWAPTDKYIVMMPKTSPSIAAVPSGGYEIAIHASAQNSLYLVGPLQQGDTGMGMAVDSSPSIAVRSDGTFAVAMAGSSNNNFWFYGKNGGDPTRDLKYKVGAGVSPSIAALSPPAIPGVPTGLQVTMQAGTSVTATASWNVPGGVISRYDVSYTCPGTTYSGSASVAAAIKAWAPLPFSKRCTFKAAACNISGCSSSAEVTKTTPAQPTPPPPTPTTTTASWEYYDFLGSSAGGDCSLQGIIVSLKKGATVVSSGTRYGRVENERVKCGHASSTSTCCRFSDSFQNLTVGQTYTLASSVTGTQYISFPHNCTKTFIASSNQLANSFSGWSSVCPGFF